MTAKDIITSYISFFESRDHRQISNAPLVPENDPTTLFTSSGMQPLIPYLLGESHPAGKRLVNAQNCFRAVDIDEVGDDRHTTFFRMLGNWSLGDYFKQDQLTWFFFFLTQTLGIDPHRLYVTVFAGDADLPEDKEAIEIWSTIFKKILMDAPVVKLGSMQQAGEVGMQDGRIFAYNAEKNWWSRSGTPDRMPAGEPGGPDSEIFYDFGSEHEFHENSEWKDKACHVNCDCGRYWEIGNCVFMQYKKEADGSFSSLPKQNVDFGGGLERLIGATENNPDMFKNSHFKPTIIAIEKQTGKLYEKNKKAMQVIADHLGGSIFIIASGVKPANKDQGYILRRHLRRSFDYFYELKGKDLRPILEAIAQQYVTSDAYIKDQFEKISMTILEEEQRYDRTRKEAQRYIEKKYPIIGDELMGLKEISSEDAYIIYTTHGLSPTQIRSLGYTFDEQSFADKMKDHKGLSRAGGAQKFAGGLADHQEKTVMGHTATHLLQQALRDSLGNHVYQTGSNITTERLRFDFSHEEKLTDEEISKVEAIVNEKIQENLPVHFEMMPLKQAKELGAIGLFDDKYQEKVKVYFIGGSGKDGDYNAYSKEFCGGPHVEFTSKVKSFKIIKQENIGNKQRRLYAHVG